MDSWVIKKSFITVTLPLEDFRDSGNGMRSLSSSSDEDLLKEIERRGILPCSHQDFKKVERIVEATKQVTIFSTEAMRSKHDETGYNKLISRRWDELKEALAELELSVKPKEG